MYRGQPKVTNGGGGLNQSWQCQDFMITPPKDQSGRGWNWVSLDGI